MKFLNISTFYKFAASTILIIGFTSCLKEEISEDEKRLRQDMTEIQNYIEANNIEATKGTTEYYFYKINENPDASAPVSGNIINFYYKMFLLNGTEVASYTAADGAPLQTKHDSDAILPVGVDIGFHHIKKGETARVILPSVLAFGNYSNGKLPEYSNVIYELEVVDILTEDQQKVAENTLIEQYIVENEIENVSKLTSGLIYKMVEEGTGSIPTNGNTVYVSYKGSLLNGTVFDESEEGKPFQFRLGNNTVIPGWEQGIPLMQKGEKAKLILPSHLAYRETFTVVPNSFKIDMIEKGVLGGSKVLTSRSIPPFSVLIFDVTLEDIK